MKRDDLISLLLRRAGQREGDSKLQTQMLDELRFLQENYERNGVPLDTGGIFWPSFLISEVSSAKTEIGEPRMPLPSDFIMESEAGSLFLKIDNVWTEIRKEEWDDLRERYSDTSRPRYYAKVGKYFYLFPAPDKEYDLRLLYYKEDEELSSNIENKWLKYASGLMLSGLGVVLAGQYTYDGNLYERFRIEHAKAAQQLYNSKVAEEETNYDRIKGL